MECPKLRIGYLVPEFPGQTHAFFWRELGALSGAGVDAAVISTRRPARALVSHAWSAQAAGRTTYLSPPHLGRVLAGLLRAGPTGLVRALASVARCDRRLRPLLLLAPAAETLHLARRGGWEHLHAHSAADAAHVAMLCRRLGGPPYSITLHGPLGDYGPNQAEKWRHAAFGIVITRRLLAEVRGGLGDALPDNLLVAPMGVDLRRFERRGPYEPWVGSGPARLFCCARLNRVKGHAELLRAVALLRGRGIDVRLTLAGQDDRGGTGYRRELEDLVGALGLANVVSMPGAVDEAEVVRGLHGSHAFVLASHHEPLGVAIMEAMAAGVPVVATRGGGVTELVTDGVDGLLVTPRDVDALSGAIERLLREPALACRLAAAGVDTVSRGFHPGVSAAAIVRGIRSREGAVAEAKAGVA